MGSNSGKIPLMGKVRIGLSLLGARFFGIRTPLLVGWSITDRCQYRCQYCGLCGDGQGDLPTGRILDIVHELYKAGCRRIQFTGGEPLLRDDIGQILALTRSLGISTSISTNGVLVPDRLDQLMDAGQVNLSVDGPEEIQDSIRSKGSFAAVIKAADALKNAGLTVRFAAVLHAQNLDQIDFLLELTEKYRSQMTFQPVTLQVLGKDSDNPLAPNVDKYRAAVDHLIEAHKQSAPIGNSLPGLMHMRKWPTPTAMMCVGGKIFYRIEADGGLVNCQRRGGAYDASLAEGDITAALKQVKAIGCTECWSAPVVEASCIMRGKLSAVYHLNRSM